MPDFSAGEFPCRRFQHGRVFKSAQNLEVALYRRRIVHGHIHRRRNHPRARAAHKAKAHRIVGDTAGEFTDDICRRGHNQVKVCPARKVYMLKGTCLDGSVFQVHGTLAKACEGQRCHEFSRSVSHAYAHFGALLLQKAQQFAAFIDGDSARDSEENFLSGQVHILKNRKMYRLLSFKRSECRYLPKSMKKMVFGVPEKSVLGNVYL